MNKCNESLEIYQIYREQVNQENNLYYKRLGWFATAQGVLIAAAGVFLQAAFDDRYEDYSKEIFTFVWCLSLAGLFSCAVAHTKLTEARVVLKWLHNEWSQNHKTWHPNLPHVTGGNGAKIDTTVRSGQIPHVFALVWIIGMVQLIPDGVFAWLAAIILAISYWLSWPWPLPSR